MGFITVYNGMSVITTKSLNKLHFNKILQSANIFQQKKNSSCSLLIYRLVEITNYFCTLKSVDIYSIVKTVGYTLLALVLHYLHFHYVKKGLTIDNFGHLPSPIVFCSSAA